MQEKPWYIGFCASPRTFTARPSSRSTSIPQKAWQKRQNVCLVSMTTGHLDLFGCPHDSPAPRAPATPAHLNAEGECADDLGGEGLCGERGRCFRTVASGVWLWLATGLVFAIGVGIFAASLLVRVEDVRDAAELDQEMRALTELTEQMAAAALLPAGAGGGLAAVEAVSAHTFEKLDALEPRVTPVLAEYRLCDNCLAPAREALRAYHQTLLDGFEDPDDPMTVERTLAFFGVQREIEEITAAVSARTDAATADLRGATVAGATAVGAVGIVLALVVGLLSRRARALRERERAMARSLRAEQSERRKLEALAGSVSAGLLMTDYAGTVTFCNERASSLLALDAGAVVGRSVSWFAEALESRAADGEAFRWGWQTLNEAVYSWPTDEFAFSGDGSAVFQFTAFPVLDDGGDVQGRGYFIIDVTRERAVDRMKTEFIGLASHELRTPLTGIQGFSELLRAAPESPHAREWADRINREAGRLASIVESLLSVSRIERGALELASEAVPIAPLIREAVAIMHLDDEGIHRVEVSHDEPNLAVHGDPERLLQVLVNLLDNAVKYSPGGGSIRIDCTQEDEAVRLSVADEGLGIPADRIGRVFDRFERIGGEERAAIRGTGLGLYIVREFVHAMGGTVTVESGEGDGSTFTVTLPIAAAREVAA